MSLTADVINDYIHSWMENQFSFGYILVDEYGTVLDWAGQLDRLGLPPIEKERPITEQLLFTEGLFPVREKMLYLPMVKADSNHSLDVHLFKAGHDYCLFLLDVTKKSAVQAGWQQVANELALQRVPHKKRSSRGPSAAGDRPVAELICAMDFAAFMLADDGQLRPIGILPGWWSRFFADLAPDAHLAFDEDNALSFLANFMEEARDFWANGQTGYIKSGIWIETGESGREHFFEAFAVVTDSAYLLMIAHNLNFFHERQAIIQQGRELAMDHGRLERMHGRIASEKHLLEEQVQRRTRQLQKANARLANELQRRKHLESERHEILCQLQQTQKMEAIGTLAGGIAHDFNNILSAILGYTELSLAETKDDTTIHSDLQQVLKAAQRARDLIRQILTFSRRSEHQLKPISLKNVIGEALKLLRASIPANIGIKQALSSSATIIADPTQMHQVIMNLCTNAMQAMQPDGGELFVGLRDCTIGVEELSAHPDLQPGAYIELTVKDTGQGISPGVLQRIFDPFFTTKKAGSGTGMGLSVVHGIVKDCHGAITVQSKPGVGSQFTVMLPEAETAEACAAPTDAAPATGRETILFVDDEILQVDLARQMLGRLGYKVFATTDCIEALELIYDAPNRFDLVISDLSMPKMNGRILSRRIREIRPDIPIILCSGYGSPPDLQSGNDAHISVRLAKPFSIKEIASTVRQLLDRKQ